MSEDKLVKHSRKHVKALDCSVVKKLITLERNIYLYTDKWKKKYRYTLIDEFRRHVTACKNNTIYALEFDNREVGNKMQCYQMANIELVLAESNMVTLIDPDINVMSEDEWIKCSELINQIHIEINRLYSKLNSINC